MKTNDFLELRLHLKCDPYIGETHGTMELKEVPPVLPDVEKDTPPQLPVVSKFPLDLSQSQIKL